MLRSLKNEILKHEEEEGLRAVNLRRNFNSLVGGQKPIVKEWKTGEGGYGYYHAQNSVSFSPDGTKLVSGSRDNTVKLWDVQSGEVVQSFEGFHNGKTRNGITYGYWEGHSDTVFSVSFSPDGTKVVSGSADKTVKVWDVDENSFAYNECLLTLKGHSEYVRSVAFSPDGSKVASGSSDNTVKLWDVTSNLQTLEDLNRHSSDVGPISGKISGMSSKKCLTLDGHSWTVNSVSFSPDGTKVASGSDDWTVKLWDVTSGNLLQTLRGHSSSVKSVSFSPDGTQLASGSYDKTVKLWDVTSGESLKTLKGHSDEVNSVSFSPDGTKIASGSRDKTMKLWDVTSGECLQTLKGHSYIVRSVSFSPDGRTIAAATGKRSVILWHVTSQILEKKRREINRFKQVIQAQKRKIFVAFHDNGKYLELSKIKRKFLNPAWVKKNRNEDGTIKFPKWIIDMKEGVPPHGLEIVPDNEEDDYTIGEKNNEKVEEILDALLVGVDGMPKIISNKATLSFVRQKKN